MDAGAKTALRLGGLVVVMAGLSFAAVPFYDWFCRVTGYGGATNTADRGAERVLDKTIKVRFDSNVAGGMPWRFRPQVREVELKIGETGIAFYEARNTSDRVVAGTASYNVTPYSAGNYFTKIECFCFTQQVLQPGEAVLMPVTFYVDPDIVDDIEAKYAHTITLSYTFYETEPPEAAARPAADRDV